jgi:hypothetical protein
MASIDVADEPNEPTPITDAMIARRAFEISLTDDTGTPTENWARAERELREEQARQNG